MKHYLIEFLGTFIVMLTVIFSGEPWAIGLIFAAMIYIANQWTQGYYNPAIASALWWNNPLHSHQILKYSIAHIAGATLAALYFFLISGDYFVLDLPAGVMFADVALREMVFTFILCNVVLTTRYITEKSYHASLLIGFTLAGLTTMGGLYNPALFLGTMLCNMAELHTPSLESIVTFVAAPLVGALLATYFTAYINKQEKREYLS